MRMKLEVLCQGSQQTVSEYVHELQELFNMVGAMPLEFKVLKLWYTLRPRIQKTMWKDGLHPGTSTWDEIVAKAKVIEIADHVIDPQERKLVQTTSTQHNVRNSTNHNNYYYFGHKNKNSHATATASRSMSYAPRNQDGYQSHNHAPPRNGSMRPSFQD